MIIFKPKIIYPLAALAITLGLTMNAQADTKRYDLNQSVYEVQAKSGSNEDIDTAIKKVMPSLLEKYKFQGSPNFFARGHDSDGKPATVFVWVANAMGEGL